jgi:hypothetical protein
LFLKFLPNVLPNSEESINLMNASAKLSGLVSTKIPSSPFTITSLKGELLGATIAFPRTAYSNIFPGGSELNGTVTNQGAFNATVGRSSDGARFTGTLSARSGSGTWVNSAAGMNGNWTGTKQ